MIIKANCILNIVSKVMCWKTLTYSSMSRSWSGNKILSGSWSWANSIWAESLFRYLPFSGEPYRSKSWSRNI